MKGEERMRREWLGGELVQETKEREIERERATKEEGLLGEAHKEGRRREKKKLEGKAMCNTKGESRNLANMAWRWVRKRNEGERVSQKRRLGRKEERNKEGMY